MLSNDEIRLIVIHPAPDDAADTTPIQCDIKVVTLSTSPDYEAVSYVWGNETSSASFELSGQTVSVAPTLHNALFRLRLPDRERILWIDQLCIKQEDLEEKMQQVRLMRKIYSSCTQCIIWMGEVPPDSRLEDADAVFKYFRYLGQVAQTRNEKLELPVVVRDNFDNMIKAMKSFGGEGNQWWQRIWTVQEAILPKHRTMQWGPLTLPWTMLKDAKWTWLNTKICNGVLSTEQWDVLGTVFVHVIWLGLSEGGYDELYYLIHRWRFRKAKDVRDKVYGILGICEPGRLPITERCDYNVAPERVFTTLTRELILDKKNLRPLTPYPRPDSSSTTPGIPSWAIDLGSTGQPDVPDLYYQMHGYEHYSADEDLGSVNVAKIRSEMGLNSLSLDGVKVDEIEHVEKGYRKTHGLEKDFTKTEPLLPPWYDVAMLHCPSAGSKSESIDHGPESIYPGGSYNRKEAFMRLVLGDTIRNFNQHPVRNVSKKDLDDVSKMVDQKGDRVNERIRRTVYGMMANQNMFITKGGLIGLGHFDVQVGDEVWIFKGGNIPFTIRPRALEAGSGYTFLGHCYVQGVMRGELGKGRFSEIDLSGRTVSLW